MQGVETWLLGGRAARTALLGADDGCTTSKAQALEEALRVPQLPSEAVAGFLSLLWTCQALGFGTGKQPKSTAAAVELGWLEELRGAPAQTDVAVVAHRSRELVACDASWKPPKLFRKALFF